ncbi:MAG: D-glycero-alpha-D-manno-heptose-1,7-bisphosphate 7-phosphatase [Gemmatimonadota bacterium]
MTGGGSGVEGAGSRPAVFLDRDGTLIREREYLADPEGVELVDGVAEALKSLRKAGYALVVVTNQSGIARGYYTEEDYRTVAGRLDAVLEDAGAFVDATYHCPHHPEETGPCECRKPGTGMHRKATRRLGLDPQRSWFVGDKLSDVVPARTLGGEGILVRTGYGRETEPRLPDEFFVADDLLGAAGIILARGDLSP